MFFEYDLRMICKPRKILFLQIFVLLSSFSFADDFKPLGSGEVFKLNPVTDGILFGTGAALSGADLILDNVLEVNRAEYDGETFDKDDVNAFDRKLMREYSSSKDKAADFVLAAAMATPIVLIPTGKNEWFSEAVMYAETLLIANGIKEITKLCVNRVRPYMYYDSGTWPESDVDEGDYANSFPSGHTTIAFVSATFTSYTFSKYFPDSAWKYPVIAGSYALAAGTSALRLMSGNHFMTDVIAGAAIGSAVGFLVPWLHTFNTSRDLNVSLLANGIAVKIQL